MFSQTVRGWLGQARMRFERAGLPSPRVDAEWLLEHVLGLSRATLMLELDRGLGESELKELESLAQRREAREPMQWLVGHCGFYGLDLRLRPGVLIPRPETERLTELALGRLATMPAVPEVLDLGCGSGAIGLAIKHEWPQAQVTATDINPLAVQLSRENAQTLGLEVKIFEASLLTGLGVFDLIVSNPPYLPTSDLAALEPEVQYEPGSALFAGPDGLGLARQLVEQAPKHLRAGGCLLLELDPRNVSVLAEEMRTLGWVQVRVEQDLTGRARFLLAQPPRDTQG